ncbi:MAG TPA: TIM barrel protein [Terriglobales bacterium]|nr:TIM barrel protein [Terriglobales bacterium]
MKTAGKLKRGVTLYSYQEEYYTRAMTLEDCLAEMAAIGAEGVELLPEQMVPDYPNPSQSWVDEWFRLLKKYSLKPACMDTFVDTTWGGHREMSTAEAVQVLVTHMKLADRLGFRVIRPTTGPVPDAAVELIQQVLPHAEKYNVKVAVEIHAPTLLRSQFIDTYLELIAKTGTKHFGFTPDMGLFCRTIPGILIEHFVRRGANPEILEQVNTAVRARRSQDEISAVIAKMGGREPDHIYGFMANYYYQPENNPKDIEIIAPYVYNIHGKFYEMNEDLVEPNIPYDLIIPALIEAGCTGYINSEYEGQRLTQDAYETDSCEQVRRHQLMMAQLLGEIPAASEPAPALASTR